MEQVELVSVTTNDGIRLHGVLQRAVGESALGVDLVVFHHGRGTNFYGSSMFGELAEYFLSAGCSVLRVNNRGHDHAYQTSKGWFGSAYEIVDDFRHDNTAWLDFAESAGYSSVLAWGHSLGATKLLYQLGVDPDPRVTSVIASSPPRFHYESSIAGEEGEQRLAAFSQAEGFVVEGEPESLVEFEFGITLWFSAHSLLDKYGPADRYDFVRHLPSIKVPTFITLGELEDTLPFQTLATDGSELAEQQPNLTYASIEGADHSYSTRIPAVWAVAREWLTT